MFATSRHGPAVQPVLRSSCDHCAASKVKCDKQRPQCMRCTSSGAHCVYGVSRKHRRPRSIVVQPEERGTYSSGSNAMTASVHHGMTPPRLQAQSIYEQQQQHHYRSNAGCPTPSSTTNSDKQSSWELLSPDILDHQNDASMPMDQVVYDHNLAFLDAADLEPTDRYPRRPDRNFSTAAAIPAWASNMPAMTTASPPNWQRQSCISRAQAHPSLTTSSPSRSEDCHTAALSTLQTLRSPTSSSHHHQQAFPSADSPRSANSTSSPTRYDPSPPLDEILHLNRSAIQSVLQLITCPCAQSPYLAMLYASIMSQVLAWYQTAAGIKPATPHPHHHQHHAPTRSPTTSSISSGSLPSRRTATAASSISLGTFELDDPEACEALGRQVLLSELKKVARAIEILASADGGVGEGREKRTDAEERERHRAEGLYVTLGQWLREECRWTVGEVRKAGGGE